MNRLSIFEYGTQNERAGRNKRGEVEENYYEGNKFNDPKEYETAAQVVMRDKTHKICKKVV